MTVAELGRRMSSAEFGDWIAYAEVEPFGPLHEDERAGVIAAVLANIYRKSGHKPFGPMDFFQRARPVADRLPTPAELGAKIRAALAAAAPRRVRKVARPAKRPVVR